MEFKSPFTSQGRSPQYTLARLPTLATIPDIYSRHSVSLTVRRNNAISDIETRLIKHPHNRHLLEITWTQAHEQDDKVNIAPSRSRSKRRRIRRRRRWRRESCWGVTVSCRSGHEERCYRFWPRGGGKSRGVRGRLLVEGRGSWLAGRGPAPRWRGAELMAGSARLSTVRHGPYLVRERSVLVFEKCWPTWIPWREWPTPSTARTTSCPSTNPWVLSFF